MHRQVGAGARRDAVCTLDVVRPRKEADRNDAPDAGRQVDGHGVDDVVELVLEHHFGRLHVEHAADGADDGCGPRVHEARACTARAIRAHPGLESTNPGIKRNVRTRADHTRCCQQHGCMSGAAHRRRPGEGAHWR